jgi:hypothetical protein
MNYYYTGLPCKLQANIHLIFALGFALAKKYIETFTRTVHPAEISCFSSGFSCKKANTETKKKTVSSLDENKVYQTGIRRLPI